MHTRMAQHCWTALHSHSHMKQWFSFLHPDWTTCLNITLRKTTFLEHTPGIEDDWEHLTRLALGDCFCCLIKAFCFFPNTSQVLCLWYETWKKGHWKEPRSPHGLAAVATDTHTRNRYKSTGKHHISHLWLWVCWICVQNMPRVLHVRTVWIKEDLTSHIWRNTTLWETYIFVEGYIYIRVWK